MTVCISQAPTATWTSTTDGKHIAPGTRLDMPDGKSYIAIQASGAIAQYDAVGMSEAYAGAPLTKAMADDAWKVGVAPVAIAANAYGFVQVRGVCELNVLASCAADVALYTSATAGSLDDTDTSQTEIVGIVASEADGGSGGNVAAFMPVEPFVNL